MTPINNSTKGQTPDWNRVSNPVCACIEMARSAMAEMEEHLHELRGLLLNCIYPLGGCANRTNILHAIELIQQHRYAILESYEGRIRSMLLILGDLESQWHSLAEMSAFTIPTVAEMEWLAEMQTEAQSADEQAAALAEGFPDEADLNDEGEDEDDDEGEDKDDDRDGYEEEPPTF